MVYYKKLTIIFGYLLYGPLLLVFHNITFFGCVHV
jgi:hypothetical protein